MQVDDGHITQHGTSALFGEKPPLVEEFAVGGSWYRP